MIQKSVEKTDIDKTKELFEYEMTEVVLKLKGEIAVISEAKSRYSEAAIDSEKLRVDPVTLPKVEQELYSGYVPEAKSGVHNNRITAIENVDTVKPIVPDVPKFSLSVPVLESNIITQSCAVKYRPIKTPIQHRDTIKPVQSKKTILPAFAIPHSHSISIDSQKSITMPSTPTEVLGVKNISLPRMAGLCLELSQKDINVPDFYIESRRPKVVVSLGGQRINIPQSVSKGFFQTNLHKAKIDYSASVDSPTIKLPVKIGRVSEIPHLAPTRIHHQITAPKHSVFANEKLSNNILNIKTLKIDRDGSSSWKSFEKEAHIRGLIGGMELVHCDFIQVKQQENQLPIDVFIPKIPFAKNTSAISNVTQSIPKIKVPVLTAKIPSYGHFGIGQFVYPVTNDIVDHSIDFSTINFNLDTVLDFSPTKVNLSHLKMMTKAFPFENDITLNYQRTTNLITLPTEATLPPFPTQPQFLTTTMQCKISVPQINRITLVEIGANSMLYPVSFASTIFDRVKKQKNMPTLDADTIIASHNRVQSKIIDQAETAIQSKPDFSKYIEEIIQSIM